MQRTIERLRAEFLEMPGLRLTAAQLQRLCGLDEAMCRNVLDALVNLKFLRANPDGTYARPSDSDLHGRAAQSTARHPVRKAS